MSLLLGVESVALPLSRAVVAGRIQADKWTALTTDTVAELVFKTNSEQLATEAWVGIYEDSGGFPGKLLEQKKVVVAAGEHLVKATGLKVKINAGSVYWLAAVSTTQPWRTIGEKTTLTEEVTRSVETTYTGGLAELEAAKWKPLSEQRFHPLLNYAASAAAPVITKPAEQSSPQNVAITPLFVTATDTTEYKAIGLPAGIAINAATGEIKGEPTTTVFGQTVTLTCKGPGGESSVTFTWGVFGDFAKKVKAIPGLGVYYRFNERTGTTARNSGPHGAELDGTYTGSQGAKAEAEGHKGECRLNDGVPFVANDASAGAVRFVGNGWPESSPGYGEGKGYAGEVLLPEQSALTHRDLWAPSTEGTWGLFMEIDPSWRFGKASENPSWAQLFSTLRESSDPSAGVPGWGLQLSGSDSEGDPGERQSGWLLMYITNQVFGEALSHTGATYEEVNLPDWSEVEAGQEVFFVGGGFTQDKIVSFVPGTPGVPNGKITVEAEHWPLNAKHELMVRTRPSMVHTALHLQAGVEYFVVFTLKQVDAKHGIGQFYINGQPVATVLMSTYSLKAGAWFGQPLPAKVAYDSLTGTPPKIGATPGGFEGPHSAGFGGRMSEVFDASTAISATTVEELFEAAARTAVAFAGTVKPTERSGRSAPFVTLAGSVAPTQKAGRG